MIGMRRHDINPSNVGWRRANHRGHRTAHGARLTRPTG